MRLFIKGDSHVGLTYADVDLTSNAEDVFAASIDEAIKNDVHFFIDLGDLFHTSTPDPETYAAAIRQLRRLSEAGIFTFILQGNHDCSYRKDKRGALAPLIEMRMPFVQPVLDCMVIGQAAGYAFKNCHADHTEKYKDATQHDCCFVFLPFVPKSKLPEGEQLDKYITHTVESAADIDVPVIYFFHYEFKGAIINPDNSFRQVKAVMPNSLRQSTIPALGVGGHIHTPQILQREPYPIIYTGSAQAMSFADAKHERGMLLVDTERL